MKNWSALFLEAISINDLYPEINSIEVSHAEITAISTTHIKTKPIPIPTRNRARSIPYTDIKQLRSPTQKPSEIHPLHWNKVHFEPQLESS